MKTLTIMWLSLPALIVPMSRRAFYGLTILAILQSASLPALSWDYDRPIISQEMPTGAVRDIVARAEQAARQQNMIEAGQFLAAAVSLCPSNTAADLTLGNDDDGPLSLQLHFIRLQYLNLAEHFFSAALAGECRALLTNYADVAQGRGWEQYKNLAHMACAYYKNKGRLREAFDLYRQLLTYDPEDQRSVRAFIALVREARVPLDDLRAVVMHITRSCHTLPAETSLLQCWVQEREGKLSLATMLAWFDTYPHASFETLQEALQLAALCLDPANPAELREYCLALTRTALRQPGDETHIATIACIINEKKKIEAIMNWSEDKAPVPILVQRQRGE